MKQQLKVFTAPRGEGFLPEKEEFVSKTFFSGLAGIFKWK